MKLDPNALAQAEEFDDRPGVQQVDERMIFQYVSSERLLTIRHSADAFATWLFTNWFDFADDPSDNLTNREVIDGALEAWRN